RVCRTAHSVPASNVRSYAGVGPSSTPRPATTRDEQPAARRETRTKLSMPRILALAFVGLLTVLAGQLHAANCGNGNPNPGEQCDDGLNNGTAGSCCTTTCTFKTSGTACTDDGNVCTTDLCNGASNICQHAPGNSGTTCRAAANECDNAELCTGSSSTCPNDTVKASGTACTDDGNVCTTDLCNGTVGSPLCVHNPGNSGTTCRAAAGGGCDVAETCT